MASESVAAALILAASALGESGRKGFEVAVEYTAPAFWGFMTLLGLVAMRMALASRVPGPNRLALRLAAGPFCALCAYMLHASVAYAGRGAPCWAWRWWRWECLCTPV